MSFVQVTGRLKENRLKLYKYLDFTNMYLHGVDSFSRGLLIRHPNINSFFEFIHINYLLLFSIGWTYSLTSCKS